MRFVIFSRIIVYAIVSLAAIAMGLISNFNTPAESN